MKALRLNLLILMTMSVQVYNAQIDAMDDVYILRSDTGLDYRLNVKDNDTPKNDIKIFGPNKLGSSAGLYSITVIDSQYIHITSTGADTFSGSFSYRGRNSAGLEDSAVVSFTRANLIPNIRPGDANLDNVVNHFDIFPLGIHHGRYGSPRHNIDTNISFSTPKSAGNWMFSLSNGINAHHADIDGNGFIDNNDFEKLKINIGLSAGTYSPRLSDTIGLSQLIFEYQDTIFLKSSDSGKIRIPLKFQNMGTQASYGLGFGITVQNRNSATSLDTFYPKYSYTPVSDFNLWNKSNQEILYIEDKKSALNQMNVAYCKTNGVNDNIGNDGGIVEVIVDDILWGITRPGDYARLRLNLKDIAYIDAEYNTIPIKPVSKYIYITKADASIGNNPVYSFHVYPTRVNSQFIIEKSHSRLENYRVYNAIGQAIDKGQIVNTTSTISADSWPQGLYYIRMEQSSQTFKIIKE